MTAQKTSGKSHGSRSARLIVFFVLLVLALFLTLIHSLTRQPPPPPAGEATSPGETTTATADHVYDGDTLRLHSGRKVRLLGIDALDSHNENRLREQAWQLGMGRAAVRKWSDRATRRAKELVEDRPVRLEFGPERADEYGRLLAYVFFERDGRSANLNRLLLREGLATATRSFPHPRREAFIALEQRAKNQNRGLWKDATAAP